MQEQIDKDLKAAMLAGDKAKVETLRGLKNGLQYQAVNLNVKIEALSIEQVQKVLAAEAKRRQEAADIYTTAGETERAAKELSEKKIIEAYLPEQLDETAVKSAIEEEISQFGSPSMQDMGKIIGAVKAKLGSSADGATIARLVKEVLS